jgi:hypothetical protein
MVQATLELMRHAHGEGASDYYQLLSDSCYPIKSNRDIARKLGANAFNYITINHELTPQSPLYWRVKRHHWPDLMSPRSQSRVYKLSRRLAARFSPRRLPRGIRFYKGWQWWCLSHECIAYILGYVESHPEIVRFCRYTFIPDEMFFHTIIGNSEYARTLSPGFAEGTIAGNHYIRWAGGKPCVLKADAFEALIESDACFARKFDEAHSSRLIAMLRDYRGGTATNPSGAT